MLRVKVQEGLLGTWECRTIYCQVHVPLGIIPNRVSRVRLANLRLGGSAAGSSHSVKTKRCSLAKERYSNAKDTAI